MNDYSPFGIGFGAMFTVVPIFIGIVFLFVFGTIIFRAVGGVSRWNSNNHRMELPLKGEEYGVLMEGDVGNLTYQGTRYKGFERAIGA